MNHCSIRRLLQREEKARLSSSLLCPFHSHSDELLRLASNEMIKKLISMIVQYLRQVEFGGDAMY